MRQNSRNRYRNRDRKHICYLLMFVWLFFSFCSSLHTPNMQIVYAGQEKQDFPLLETESTAEGEEGLVLLDAQNAVAKLTFGIDGIVRYGRTVMISADIFSVTESFEGQIAVTCINADGSNKRYSHTFLVKKEEEKTISIPVPMNGYTESLLLQFIENGTIKAEKKIALSAVNYGNYKVIGLLSENTNTLSYFDSFGNRIVALEESTFPNTIAGLDFMDIIVIDDFDTSKLTSSQAEALLTFVKSGRTVVFGTGEQGTKCLSVFLNEGEITLYDLKEAIEQDISLVSEEDADVLRQKISAYENERTTILSRNEQQADEEFGIRKMYVGESMILEGTPLNLTYQMASKKIASFSVANAFSVNVSGNETLLWRLTVGEGVIEIASFSLGEERNGSVTFFQASIVDAVLENQSKAGVNRIRNEYYGFSSKYLLANVLDHPNTDAMPSISMYVVAIVLYIILIGPLLYLILRKRRRQHLLYALVPALSSLFFLILFLVGSTTRITQPYAGYINVEQYDPLSHTMNAELSFSISLPYMKKQELSMENTSYIIAGRDSFPYYNDYSSTYISKEGNDDADGKEYTVGVSYQDGRASVIIQNTRAFCKNYFYTRYEAQADPLVEGSIIMGPKSIFGKIENTSTYDLYDVYLYCSGILVSLKDLESGKEIAIEGKDTDFICNRDMIYFSEMVLGLAEEKKGDVTAEDYRKEYALQYVLEKLYERDEQAYIIGFKDEPSESIPIASLLDRRGAYGNSIVIIPITAEYALEEGEFAPNMDAYMHVVEGTVESGGYRYLLTDAVTIDYHFPESEHIDTIYYSDFFNRIAITSYIPQFSGDIYFWNNATGQYDRIFTSGIAGAASEESEALEETASEERLVGDAKQWMLKSSAGNQFLTDEIKGKCLEDYLDEDHILQVRIKATNSDLIYTNILPYLSYSRGAR